MTNAPHKMTRAQYKVYRAAELRTEYPDVEQEAIDYTLLSADREWFNLVLAAGENERLTDEVLDDLVANHGMGVLRWFRGTAQIGAEGYIPATVRNKPAEIVFASEAPKQPHEQTLAEYRKAQVAGVKYRIAPAEYREIRKQHKVLVQNALYRHMPVPQRVLVDYPELSA
jgi:hypothetical protein